ncbi:MAG: type I restriction endonuclease [Solirubrobacteraceae bacterium]
MTATLETTENAFEREVVRELLGPSGWIGEDPDAGPPQDWRRVDPGLGLLSDDLAAFVADSQPKAWERLSGLCGGEAAASEALSRRVASECDRRGTIDVLRRGTTERGVRVQLAYFAPELQADASATRSYDANLLRVVRQVRFDAHRSDALDLVLLVNGIPTATAELKTRQKGQSVVHAKRQYAQDRPGDNPLLGRRALVHFAVDEHEVVMTTRLAGAETRFLPFNQGSGAPVSPGSGQPGTTRRWSPEQLPMALSMGSRGVARDPRALRLVEDEGRVIFPRFHQWDVVREASARARVRGPGGNYLIQHSAGSGKSKEIAWLAHELSTVHGEAGKVFDKVIVITDRRVLDAQLQSQVLAFEQVKGTVQRVDRDSAQLRAALAGEQARIVITTLQKFPFVLRQIEDEGGELKARSYAVIVDEAHSSQTGESAKDLKAVLGGRTIDDLDLDAEERDGVPEALLAAVSARGRQPNLSFFAFTATPKGKTLNLFGDWDEHAQTYRAFHTYSMRQAVEEGFILDVLANYTTYQQLWRLEARAAEHFEVPEGEGRRQIARFAKWHAHSKAQKAQVILDHFRAHVQRRLGGQAKAMIVTASREEAALYKKAIDRHIERERIPGLRSLVAFSGEVTITNQTSEYRGQTFTEPAMNARDGVPLPESQLPATFERSEYGLLTVAEKYQVGFDQPKLVAMYVDKVLTGVNAVQTLSRLNRTLAGKGEVFVLDFVNDEEQIRKAFEPYYKLTTATAADPNELFDAKRRVEDHHIVTARELEDFADGFFHPDPDSARQHSRLSTLTRPAYDRSIALEDPAREELRDALDAFVRRYSFMSQVLAWLPPDTEVFFAFAGVLAARLRDDSTIEQLDLGGLLDLTHYALRQTSAGSITLGTEEQDPLRAFGGAGHGPAPKPDELPLGPLEELVKLFNDRFGADLTGSDAVRPVQQIVDHIAAKDGVADQVNANAFEDFARGKDPVFIEALLAVQDFNDEFLPKLLADPRVQKQATSLVLEAVYRRLRSAD